MDRMRQEGRRAEARAARRAAKRQAQQRRARQECARLERERQAAAAAAAAAAAQERARQERRRARQQARASLLDVGPPSALREALGAKASEAEVLWAVMFGADPAKAKKAYRRLALRLHPDKLAHRLAEELTQKLNSCWERHRTRQGW